MQLLQGPILVISPHPDDEVLGCGGVLARAARENIEAHWLIATDMAAPGPFGAEFYSADRIASRRAEIESIRNLFGFRSVHQLPYAPASLSDQDLPSLVQDVGKVIDQVKASVIFAPSERDAHSDHAIVHRAVSSCSKSFRRPGIRAILIYEVLSETGHSISVSAQPFRPNLYVQLHSADIDTKVSALEFYRSEVAAFPFPRSERCIRALANLRGSECGHEAAEAFEIARAIQ